MHSKHSPHKAVPCGIGLTSGPTRPSSSQPAKRALPRPQLSPLTPASRCRQLFVVGTLAVLIAAASGCSEAAPPPRGDRILLSSNESGNWEVLVLDVDSSLTYRITNDPNQVDIPLPDLQYQGSGDLRRFVDPGRSDSHPTWSPDGTQIAVSSNRFGNFELIIIDASGSVLDR